MGDTERIIAAIDGLGAQMHHLTIENFGHRLVAVETSQHKTQVALEELSDRVRTLEETSRLPASSNASAAANAWVFKFCTIKPPLRCWFIR